MAGPGNTAAGAELLKASGTGLKPKKPQIQFSIEDNTWKDTMRREKFLQKRWNSEWGIESRQLQLKTNFDESAAAEKKEEILKRLAEGRNLGLIPQELEKRVWNLKPSPKYPLKSSGTIGWRSADPDNSLALYPQKKETIIQKIKFQEETYGLYRVQKYLNEMENRMQMQIQQRLANTSNDTTSVKVKTSSTTDNTNSTTTTTLPNKLIRYKVNPLLC